MSQTPRHKIPSNLAQVILADRRPNIVRMFQSWELLLDIEGGHYYLSEIIDFLANKLKLHPHHIRHQIIKQGDGIFWSIHDQDVYLIGRKRVLNYFGLSLSTQGRIYLLTTSELCESLQNFKSILNQLVLSNKTICRAKIRTIINHSEQTQRNYQRTAKNKPRFNYSVQVKKELGTPKQLPNTYQQSFPIFKPIQHSMYGFEETVDTATGPNLAGKSLKVFFETEKAGLNYYAKHAKDVPIKNVYFVRHYEEERVEVFLNRYETRKIPTNKWNVKFVNQKYGESIQNV